MNSIILNNISIGYDKKVVAKGLSTEIQGGQLTCLIGRNGLGKSTLLKVVAGFITPLSGTVNINIDGKVVDMSKVSKKDLSHYVAVVLTQKVDIANISVREVVGMGRMPYTDFFGRLGNKDKKIVDESIETTGIGSLADRNIATLSDGERQKVMIARALAQQTPVILLDEPTAFLDYDSKLETMRILHSMATDMGKVVLASTHDLDIAARIADRIITIDNGVKDISVKDLRTYLSTSYETSSRQ